MSEALIRTAVPSFEGFDELCSALSLKGQGARIDLYPRDGSTQLYDAEAHIAELSATTPDTVILYNNGMSAIEDAIDVAVEQSGNSSPKIAYALELYAKTAKNIQRYARRHGLQTVAFESNDTDDIESLIEGHQPGIIIAETVANGPTVPVLNHEHLLQTARDSQKQPIVILDHTLPLSSGYDVLGDIDPEDNALVVVSGTKAYTLNAELSGVTFVKNPAFQEALRSLRCDRGSLSGVASTEFMASLLPETKGAFDERNRRIYAKTGALALQLFGAQQEAGADFVVHHPALPVHPDHDYVLTKNEGQITPVFYIQALGVHQTELAKRLGRHPTVAEHTHKGQSFGFGETRILPDADQPVVRIAGGANTDTAILGPALAEAILAKS